MALTMIGAPAPENQLQLFELDATQQSRKENKERKSPVSRMVEIEIVGEKKLQISQLTLELLSQPLLDPESDIARKFGCDDLEEEQSFTESQLNDEPVIAVQLFGDNGTKSWGDNDIAILHEAMIEWHLSQLARPGNVEKKLEALEWLYQPDVYERRVNVREDGTHHVRYILANQIPFTFQHACMLTRYNGEVLLNGLEHALRKKGLDGVLKAINGEDDDSF